MKGWQKALIALAAAAVLIATALGIFLATFDVQKYRPLLQEKLSQAAGAPVTLGRISLAWKGGVAVRLDDVSVFVDAERSQRLLHLESISGTVDLASLIGKEVRVASLFLEGPTLRLVRRADGSMALPAPASQTPPSSSDGKEDPSKKPAAFSMDLLRVDNGQIVYEDRAAGPDATLTVSDIDLRARKISLDRAFPFELSAAVLSERPNVEAEGRLLLPQGGRPARLEGFKASTGLADWDIQRLSSRVPALGSIEGNVGGRLEIEASQLPLDAASLSSAAVALKLQNVAFKLDSMPFAVEKLNADARLEGEDASISSLTAEIASGTLSASGTVSRLHTEPQARFNATARELSIEDLSGSSQGRRFGGRLSFDLAASAQGRGEALARTLYGDGRISVTEGTFYELNLLREVVGKASMIPGAEGVLERELPAAYKAKMAERDTRFLPIDVPVRIEAGRAIFDQLSVSTEFIRLQGRGWMAVDRSFAAQVVLQVHPTLSRVMAQIVSPIQLLFNGGGEVEVPIQFSGKLPHVRALPDMQYLAQRLLTAQAQQLLTGFVQDPGKGLGKVGNLGEGGLQSLLRRAVGGTQTSTEGQSQ